MAITKEKKQEIVAELQQIVNEAKSIAFVNFHGLSVQDTTELRKNLRDQGVGYRVAKKTLLGRVLADSSLAGDLPELPGEIAIAYDTPNAQAGDLTAPAREVYEFHKKHKDAISIVGGVFEGSLMNQEAMLEIATIPATPVLRGMFVNVINSPIQSFVIALNAIAEKKN